MSGRAEGGASQPSKSGGFVAWYNDCLSAKPLLTTSISTMIIASSGDIMCQVRQARFMLGGTVVVKHEY
eukprot:m.190883 g.190883  ORF g.190883 m.190883 type:complete len:69 (-) comp18577_c0_seq6:1120-1326(-)